MPWKLSTLSERERNLSPPLSNNAVDDQEQDGTEGGDKDSADVERLDLPKADETTQKAAEDSANNPYEDSNEKPAGISAWHEQFCKCSGDEAEEDPRNDAHDNSLLKFFFEIGRVAQGASLPLKSKQKRSNKKGVPINACQIPGDSTRILERSPSKGHSFYEPLRAKRGT